VPYFKLQICYSQPVLQQEVSMEQNEAGAERVKAQAREVVALQPVQISLFLLCVIEELMSQVPPTSGDAQQTPQSIVLMRLAQASTYMSQVAPRA
jgi:hypothetical protein